MNYELDSYVDAVKEFPSKEIPIETLNNTYYHFKTDVFKGLLSYSTSPNFGANIVVISAQRAKEVIAMNKKGKKPDTLEDILEAPAKPIVVDYENGVGQDSLTRFDAGKKRPNNKNKRPNNRPQENPKSAANGPTQTPTNKVITVKSNNTPSEKKGENTPRFKKPIKKNNSGESTKE